MIEHWVKDKRKKGTRDAANNLSDLVSGNKLTWFRNFIFQQNTEWVMIFFSPDFNIDIYIWI